MRVTLHNPDCKSLYRLSYSFIDQNGSHSVISSMQYHQGLQDGLAPRSDLRCSPLVTFSPALTYGWCWDKYEGDSSLWASKDLPLLSYIHLWSCIAIKMLGESEREGGREDGGKTEKGNQMTLQLYEPVFALLPNTRVPSTLHFQNSGPWNVYALAQ